MERYTQTSIRFVLFSALTVIMFFFCGVIDWRVLAEDPVANPHELEDGVNNTTCVNCHRQTPERVPEHPTRAVLPNQNDFVTDFVDVCASCHEGSVESHPLGVIPKYPVPADLPLDKDNGVSCLTCHYTHGSLKSDHPRCSVSFLDRLLGRDRMRKSFLLRRENTNGELCKACHGTY